MSRWQGRAVKELRSSNETPKLNGVTDDDGKPMIEASADKTLKLWRAGAGGLVVARAPHIGRLDIDSDRRLNFRVDSACHFFHSQVGLCCWGATRCRGLCNKVSMCVRAGAHRGIREISLRLTDGDDDDDVDDDDDGDDDDEGDDDDDDCDDHDDDGDGDGDGDGDDDDDDDGGDDDDDDRL